ncbi:MAG: hypothetical protein C4541_02650 [Candidatus Auribacter fodinae]|jgi:tetratricopeptide (TPR) repeat protein|uniref:Uncharacterized protein n=1 Tax=Candidatus Auribacter fodinae TaxID=2093366 RepID=A0A3A4R4N5_9BACT|nr:MAG: hypothetical protein C4541_02650 [Candidatus Auribacter fodinae]
MKRLPPCFLLLILFFCGNLHAIDRFDIYTTRSLNSSGTQYYADKNYIEAINKFRAAYKINPHDFQTKVNLINAYIGQSIKEKNKGNYVLAEQTLREALEIEDNIPEIRMLLASIYFDRGDLMSARGELEIARLTAPDNPAITSFLGEIYFQEGDLEKALSLWTEVHKKEPYNENLTKKISRVKIEYETQKKFLQKKSHPFVVKYDPQYEKLAGSVLAILNEAYRDVGEELRYFPMSEVITLVYSEEEFKQATGAEGLIASMYDGKIRVKASQKLDNALYLKEIIYHEYTHVLIRYITKDNCPFWLNEGLAQVLSNRPLMVDLSSLTTLELESEFFHLNNMETFNGMRKSVEYDIDLNESIKIAYLKSLFATRYLISVYGMDACMEMLYMLKVTPVKDALKKAAGITIDELDQKIVDKTSTVKEQLLERLNKEKNNDTEPENDNN